MASLPFGHPPQKMLLLYVNDELDGADREPVERHIAQCPPCRQFVEALSSSRLGERIREAHRDSDPATPKATESSTRSGPEDATQVHSPGPSLTSPDLPAIPNYQTVRKLGSGGMGTVYL